MKEIEVRFCPVCGSRNVKWEDIVFHEVREKGPMLIWDDPHNLYKCLDCGAEFEICPHEEEEIFKEGE